MLARRKGWARSEADEAATVFASGSARAPAGLTRVMKISGRVGATSEFRSS